MAFELFWFSGSPFSWRVMLTLEVKQIPYTAHLLQGTRGDHKKPEYMALNPRGKVPTLRDGDVIVSESTAIMQHAEKKFPARPMFGRTALETATIYPFLALLLRGAVKEAGGELELGLLPFHGRYPRLATWMERVERQPGYERTYPPHWRR